MSLELSSTDWAARMGRKPRVHTLRVVTMAAVGQNLHLLAVFEHAQAYAALATAAGLQIPIRFLVQHNRQGAHEGGVEALGPIQRRRGGRVGGDVVEVETAEPARVEQEQCDEEDHGEDYDGDEQRLASDAELIVVKDGEVGV